MNRTIISALLTLTILTSCNNNGGGSANPNNKDTATMTNLEKIQAANKLITIGKKDSAGNEIDNGKRKIYLTFDDGPNVGTRVVIDICKELQVPATFYMIGLHRYGSPQQVALWNEVNTYPFFEVTNHSFTHAYKNRFAKFYSDMPGALNDFTSNHDSLKFNNKIVRAPGSNEWRLPTVYSTDMVKLSNRIAILDSLHKLGYYITGWDWEWAHHNNKAKQTAEQLYQEINSLMTAGKEKTKNHLVLLTHDMIFADTTDANQLRSFINMLKSDTTVELRTISQYPGCQKAFL
jgi:peptidoglycan/xylan/chitin deacetylase (PgdA/CDA1 family)